MILFWHLSVARESDDVSDFKKPVYIYVYIWLCIMLSVIIIVCSSSLMHCFNVWRDLQHIYMCSIGANNWWHPHSSTGRCSPVSEGKQHSRQQDEWCRCYIYNVDKPEEDRWNGSWPSWHPQRKGGKYSEEHRCVVWNYMKYSRIRHFLMLCW